MGSFQQGIQLGQNAYKSVMDDYQTSERLALEKEREARAAEKHGLEMSGLRRIDDATKALTDAQTLGVQVPGAQQANEGLQRQSLRQFEIAQQNGEANPQYVAPTGLQQTYRPAGVLDINSLQAALAAAKGDVAGMEALRLGRKGIEFDEGYKKHFEDWNKMDDAAKGALIDKLSLDSGVKGFGSWVAGKGKQAGYMNYLPPGGDPIKLSAKEAGDLYVLSNLMAVDPMRARAEMDKVSDKVRAVAAQAFEAQAKGVTANNTAAHYAAADANDAARTAAQGQYYGMMRDRINRPQAADLREYVDDKGQVTLLDITGLKRNADGTVPLPAGLKPRTAKPSVTPEAYAKTLKDLNEVYGDPAKARMATDQLYGLTAPTNAVADQLRALNDKKGGGVKNQSAPTAAPAAPLGLSQRLGNAVTADNAAGNRGQFMDLAAEAERNAPAYIQQLSVLRNAVGQARSPGERANLENRIGELERDLVLYDSILQQRAAQRGY